MQSAQFQLHAKIEEQHWWFVARRRIVRELVHELIPHSKRATLVDVGCGTGANLAALAMEYNCVGIDTSAEAIALARQRFPEISFVHGFAPADLGSTLSRAQLVMMMDVLEHVRDDFSLLSEMLAAASPGTYFLLTVPADQALWSGHDESFGHYRRYDFSRFCRLWEGLPVSRLLATHYNSRLYPLVKCVRTISRWRGHAGGAAGTDFHLPSRPVNRLLTEIFASESRQLVRQLHNGNRQGFRRGVSLIAVLRREAGPIAVRQKPVELAGDYFDPTDSADLQPAEALC